MNTNITLHLAKYFKYLYEPQSLLVVIGDIEEVNISRHLYEQHHGIPSIENDLQPRLLNACALAATSLSDRESWGWTLTLPGSNEGYFVGMEPEGMICIQTKPADEHMKKVYLQRQKNDGPLMQSHFEPDTDSPEKTIEQYFNQVVQTQTRVIINENTGMLIQALPNSDFGELEGLSDSQLFELFQKYNADDQLKQLSEFLVFYECRCDEKMIYEMINKLPKGQQSEIFEAANKVEIECPRCGRQYIVNKNEMMN